MDQQRQELKDFLNPVYEWRRIFAEAWGTFLLVMVGAGASIIQFLHADYMPKALAAAAPGLLVMSVIYFMGAVSGAHINPAVTLAFALRRNFPWKRVPGYWIAQFAGGILAACFLKFMFGLAGNLGATQPGPEITQLKAFIMETVLTAGLVNTILGTASGARNIGANAGIAVGGFIALSGLWADPVSGASMNPIRSLAPDLVRGNLSQTWIYIAGPLLGAGIAVGFEWILKGEPTPEGTQSAQGSE